MLNPLQYIFCLFFLKPPPSLSSVGSNAWPGWRNLKSALRSSCCRPTIRRNGPDLPSPWTLRSEHTHTHTPCNPSGAPGHLLNLPILVPAGSLRSFWPQGALLEGVWVQAQLQWPRCHQMGAVHRPLRHLRDSLLEFSPAAQQTDHFSSHLYLVDIFSFLSSCQSL